MESMLFLVTRLSVVLTLGWLAILCLGKANPRWTILTSRALLIAVVAMPFMVWTSPSWDLALLPVKASSSPSNLDASDSIASFQTETQQAIRLPDAFRIVESTEFTEISAGVVTKSDGSTAIGNHLNSRSPWLLLWIVWLLGAAALLTRVCVRMGQNNAVDC